MFKLHFAETQDILYKWRLYTDQRHDHIEQDQQERKTHCTENGNGGFDPVPLL